MSKKTLKNVALGSASALALAAAGTASAVEFQAGNSSVNVYGYAQLDVIYDVDDNLGSTSAQSMTAPNDSDNTGHFAMDATTSRLGVETRTPASMGGDVRTVIEGDFFGGSLRLRRAFGEWNGILAGQEWSNFVTFIGTSPTLSFTGTVGYPRGARNSQLRYTVDNFSIAIESVGQGDFFTGGDDGAELGLAKRSLPDLTLRYQDTSGPVNFAMGAVIRQLEWDDGDDNSETALGFGLMGAASMEIVPGTTLRGTISGGPGIGSYLYVQPAGASYTDNTSDNDIEPITAYGGTIGITQALGMGNLTLAYATTIADIDDAVDDANGVDEDANERFQQVYLNYIWSPVDRVMYGVELSWNDRETQAGDSFDAVRLQGSVRYSF